MFWTYGFRFNCFDNLNEFLNEKDQVIRNRENTEPISAFYNHFHNFVVVQTNEAIKIFTLRDGSMHAMHQHLFKNELIYLSRQDRKARKVYLASRSGQIKVINVSTGTVLVE